MFLDLCLDIEYTNGKYRAKFCPEGYNIKRDNKYLAKKIYYYLVIEAMNQISCRASSMAFYGGKRVIPVQIEEISFFREILKHDANYYLLEANIEKYRDLCKSEVSLIDHAEISYAKGTIIVSII
jgi:predicted metal-binding protein